MKALLFPFTVAVVVAAAGCSAPKDAGFSEVAAVAKDRTGFATSWTRDAAHDREVKAYVDTLLRDELTVDEAVQVALLSNQRLQATYEHLGVARGELIGAALPDNPVASDEVRFFDAGAEHEAAVTQNVMSILTIPLRRERERNQFEATIEMVADRVLHVVAETRRSYIDYQAAKQLVELLQQTVIATESSYLTMQKLREAGNVKQFDVLRERAFYEEAKIRLNTSQRELAIARERLNGAMGTWGTQAYWRTPARLPEVPGVAGLDALKGKDAASPYPKAMAADGQPGELNEGESLPAFHAERLAGPPTNEQIVEPRNFSEIDALSGDSTARFAAVETLAVERNLHLSAQRHLIDAQAAEMDREVLTALFPFLNVGVVPTWTAMDEFVFGPAAAIPVPIFDFGQAAHPREASRLRMLLEEYAAMAVELRSAARALEARLQATQANAVYRREGVLPLRAAVVAEAQLNYNAMTVTPFELITAKRQQIDAAVEYVHAVRDYWIARADLEQLLDGGRPPMVNMIGVMK
jgi:cobalt-zinc-cadmium efflux system outer membrane protein